MSALEKKLRVLIVDDSPEDRELYQRFLTQQSDYDYAVSEAKSGQEALQLCRSENPDCILLDYRLPDVDGLEFLAELYANDMQASIPVVMLTGQGNESIAIEAMKRGAQDYLVKGRLDDQLLGRTIRYSIERNSLKLELQSAERHLREIINNNADGMLILDQQGVAKFLNPAAGTILGGDHEQLLGESFGFPLTLDETTDIEIAQSSGDVRVAEMRVVETIWEGERCSLASLRDITERKKMEKALQKAHAQLEMRVEERTADLRETNRRLQEEITERKWAEEVLRLTQFSVDQASDGIQWIAQDGQFLYVNGALCRILGYSREELLSMTVLDIDPHFGPETWVKHWEKVKQAGSLTIETRNLTKYGRDVPIEVTDNYVDFGGKECIFGFIRDITERKRAEEAAREKEELARSNVELEQFAFVASHDLQEPLRTVSRYTKLLADRYKGKLDSNADDFLSFAADGAQRMQQLIHDMLAYSRVGSRGKFFEPTDCSAVCDEAIANLQVTIEESDAVVTRDSLPTVTGDGSQLVQLFQGLIGNAIKFRGEEPPRVHVSAKQNENEWIFCVHDNGIGIDSKNADRIFGIFQRLHTRAEYPGTGIGLSICKKIVERHGGRIWVESKPGKGSLLFFTLPKKKVSDLEF